MNKKLIIAIDGPAGSGKSTAAKLVAHKLGYIYADTGAMYRAVTLGSMNISHLDKQSIIDMLPRLSITLSVQDDGQHTFLNNEDVSEAIRQPEISANVSFVSSIKEVRESLVAMQREIGKSGGIVMDGRDIGTVVFPNADLKFFMVANIEQRAIRRLQEMQEKGMSPLPSLEELVHQMTVRDNMDSSREIDPLVKAHDAIEIDTSFLSIDQQVSIIIEQAHKILNADC